MSIENIQIIETVSLDFYNNNIKVINVKQLDTDSRGVKVNCTEHGKKFKLNPLSHSVFVRYKKPDGNDVLNDCYIQDDGSVIFALTQQMTAVAGKSKLDILIFCASGLTVDDIGDITNFNDLGISTLSTMILGLNIHSNATDLLNVESTYEYDALIDGLARHVAIEKHMEALDRTLNVNENVRQTNEEIRITNENVRQDNENNRIDAEIQREKNVQETIDECNKRVDTAVENAEIATTNAEIATEYANEAGDNTNAAIERANQASDEVDKLIAKYESIEDFSKIDEILNYKIEVTEEEYNALSDEEKNNGKIYFITDANMGGTASEVSYDNSNSGLTAPNVQRAIDEVNENTSKKVDKSSVVNNLITTEEGYVLDARQGKVLKDEITNLSPQFAYLWLDGLIYVIGGNTVEFDSHVIEGDTFSVKKGIVTVEKDINFVRVRATLGGSSPNNRIWMIILKNGATVYDALAVGTYVSASGGTICSAKKGDVFNVICNENLTAEDGGVGCYFNIEKIC